MGSLSHFLREQKHAFLQSLSAPTGLANSNWTVVMGNEAGDLDTQASSLAYSYLSTRLLHSPTIALSRTARPDLALRPENTLAFSRASVSPDDLLCIDDLPSPPPAFPRIALVDHNRLSSEFSGEVVGVIDHHSDEGFYPSASPRLIRTPEEAGSCTSLVTEHFRALWQAHLDDVPKEVAFLLLCTILIDTGGLKPDGKAQAVDRAAAAFLMPLAGYPSPAGLTANSEGTVPPEVEQLFTELITKKFDVAGLSTRDLLRRDYKQYSISPVEGGKGGKVELGLCTVPLGLGPWAAKDPQIWTGVQEYIAERGLDVCGILTTYRNEKGKHRRQVVLCLRERADADAALGRMLREGLEGSQELRLVREEGKKKFGLGTGEEEGVCVWKQGNVQATRKQVAPLVSKSINTLRKAL
ncbi:DHH phosphoesterase [Calocera viscosa TUFC12733]|uniref:DHH phosphoesterase n=1 Tax=Calocera viscosa (strain TUFC12733) TaxID=1330018 RepID=A0A167KI34_CALVF|nr:DHH phosphoesterase [Calocera viscosa TUFC12733]